MRNVVVTSRCPVRVDFAGAWTDVELYAGESGGAVVNATIDRYVTGRMAAGADGCDGMRVEYGCDLPSGSGLGTSGALNVCWLSLVTPGIAGSAMGDTERARIAEAAYRLEGLLGILGGRQDQYAAALGGFNFLRFDPQAHVERRPVEAKFARELEERLVLCYTGTSRLSGNIHEHVWGAYRRSEPATVRALAALRAGAYRMKAAIEQQDAELFGALLGDSWTHQKALHASVTNEAIEALFATAASAGAPHGKACGAGGGGCLLFFTRPGGRDAVAHAMSAAGAHVIPFRFEFEGLQVRQD